MKISQYVSELNVPLAGNNLIRLDWSHDTTGLGDWVTKYMEGGTLMTLINNEVETFYNIDGSFDEDRTLTSAGFDWFHTGIGRIAFGAADALGYKLRIVGGVADDALRVDTTSENNVLVVIDDGANGFVGMGTAAPSIRLQVVGDASVSANFGIGINPLVKFHILTTNPVAEPFIFQAAVAGSDGAAIFFYKHRGTQAAPTATLLNDKLGRLGWQTYGTSQKDVANMIAQATENHTVTNLGTKLYWDTTANTTAVPTTKMTLLGDGNLGLGTTAPSAKLHVVGSGRFDTTIVNGFQVDGTTFSVDGAGNKVGIGTAAPSAKLHVVGEVLIDGGLTLNKAQPFITFQEATVTLAFIGKGVNTGNSTGYGIRTASLNFDINTNSGTGVSALTVLSGSGNVGIGTAAPSAKLHVVGTTNFTTDLVVNNSQPFITFKESGVIKAFFGKGIDPAEPTAYGMRTASLDYVINTANGTGTAAIMVKTANGNVGMGQTSPTEKLHVGGNVRVSGHYKVGAIQVVGVQGAAVIDATDAASAITQLNALLARARAHGLIA